MSVNLEAIWAAVKTGKVDVIADALLKEVEGFFATLLTFLKDTLEIA